LALSLLEKYEGSYVIELDCPVCHQAVIPCENCFQLNPQDDADRLSQQSTSSYRACRSCGCLRIRGPVREWLRLGPIFPLEYSFVRALQRIICEGGYIQAKCAEYERLRQARSEVAAKLTALHQAHHSSPHSSASSPRSPHERQNNSSNPAKRQRHAHHSDGAAAIPYTPQDVQRMDEELGRLRAQISSLQNAGVRRMDLALCSRSHNMPDLVDIRSDESPPSIGRISSDRALADVLSLKMQLQMLHLAHSNLYLSSLSASQDVLRLCRDVVEDVEASQSMDPVVGGLKNMRRLANALVPPPPNAHAAPAPTAQDETNDSLAVGVLLSSQGSNGSGVGVIVDSKTLLLNTMQAHCVLAERQQRKHIKRVVSALANINSLLRALYDEIHTAVRSFRSSSSGGQYQGSSPVLRHSTAETEAEQLASALPLPKFLTVPARSTAGTSDGEKLKAMINMALLWRALYHTLSSPLATSSV